MDILLFPDEDKSPTHPQQNALHLSMVYNSCCCWSHDNANRCVFMSITATVVTSASLAYLANTHIKQL